jgi:perosamine synthetase
VNSVATDQLARFGGSKVRSRPLPARNAFGETEQAAVNEVFTYYRERQIDFGYQGHFEERYCQAFVAYQQCAGYADGVATGTAAILVALAALQLPKGSRVLVSPITDPGTLSAIVFNGLVPALMDSMPGSYNSGPEQFRARLTPDTSAAVLVHAAGAAAPVDEFLPIARQHRVRIVEDCSQAHGAKLKGRKVGTFGDIGAFSTMYRKAHATGGCGGVVFTREESLYHQLRAHADRGKPFWKPDFNDRNPSQFLFPALNLNLDEVSSAIGLKTLAKLDDTIRRRVAFLEQLDAALRQAGSVCRLAPVSRDLSPFFHPIFVEGSRVNCTAREFGEAVLAEGIGVNPWYDYVVSQWAWMRSWLADDFACANAAACRDASFNLLFNENYGTEEARDIAAAISKVERHYRKP